MRKSAVFENDRQRCGVDGTLWGSIASQLSFGSLSLNGCGLESYGPVSITISEQRALRTATFLEKNSFCFVEEHQLTPGKDIPPGYRSSWKNRHLLAGAKVAGAITAGTTAKKFPDLLLDNTDDRKHDEFIEAFIFGAFDSQAVTKVVTQGLRHLDNYEKQILKNARDLAKKRGIIWKVR